MRPWGQRAGVRGARREPARRARHFAPLPAGRRRPAAHRPSPHWGRPFSLSRCSPRAERAPPRFRMRRPDHRRGGAHLPGVRAQPQLPLLLLSVPSLPLPPRTVAGQRHEWASSGESGRPSPAPAREGPRSSPPWGVFCGPSIDAPGAIHRVPSDACSAERRSPLNHQWVLNSVRGFSVSINVTTPSFPFCSCATLC